MSYVFKSGKFKGKTVAQLCLTRYPELVNFVKWARDYAHLSEAVQSFDFLNSKITSAKLVARCCHYYPECSNPAPYMSPRMRWNGELSPTAYFWCKEHNPWKGVDKEPISIKASMRFNCKGDQRLFLKVLRSAIGMKRITKKTAKDFFCSI